MKTPSEYTNNLKKHIITSQMLLDCLYSSNKRAKNWRDKEREYRNSKYDIYDNEEKARTQKEMYYSQKETMLSILEPVCIHKEIIRYRKRRIYDYEDDYNEYINKFVYRNSYYDYEEYREVCFGDIELIDEPICKYYLFYDLQEHTFHQPISEDEIKNYSLEIVNINTLNTKGHNIEDLISNQFVSKVIELINSNDYEFIK